jgi:hypothetical protein
MQIITLQDEGTNDTAFAPDVNTFTDSTLIKETTAEVKTHKIPDFLNRLYHLGNLDWTIGEQRGEVLKTYRFPDELLKKTPIKEKITNFYGLRAGIEFVVLVNNQKFQQGNLLISYLPNAKYNPVKKAMHDAEEQGLVSRSGAPRVNLDLMDTTRASMKVPYMSPFVFYNIINKEGTIGDFYISVYSPLVDIVESGKVRLSVYARFIDVDLEFPTAEKPAVISQMPAVSEAIENLSYQPDREKLATAKTQIDEILARIDNGTFSFQMNTSASCFKQKALPKMATSNDNNLTHMLSTHSNNSLIPVNTGQASKNEMDFSTMLSIPCYYDHFDVLATDTASTNKWSEEVSPAIGPNITNADTSESADYIQAVSTLFKKWKGGIIYRFRAVKTRFHSVRLRVWFSPGSTAVTSLDRNTIYSKIIDLEVENSFTFEVPYIHPYNMLNVSKGTTSLGLIGVDIENPLVAPASVKPQFEVIVERFGAPDLQFAEPTLMKFFPFDPTVRAAEEPLIDFSDEFDAWADEVDTHFAPNLSYQMASPSSADLQLRVAKPHVEMCSSVFENPMYRGLVSSAWLFSTIPWYHFFPAILVAEVAVICTLDLAHNFCSSLLYKKDLTTEGIEPNPGPISCVSGQTAPPAPKIITSPYFGKQKITFNIYSLLGNNSSALVGFSGTVLGGEINVSIYTGLTFDVYYDDEAEPLITLTSDVPAVYNIIFNTTVNPSFHYQMGMDNEQDIERSGLSDNKLINPLICNSISNYCIGNSMSNVHQMIGRSTLFQSIESDTTGVYHLFPHAIGILNKNAATVQKISGYDNLSFFASFYTFARGTVNFRLQTTGGPYRVAIEPDNEINQTPSQVFNKLVTQGRPLTANNLVYSSNLMQQSINTNVEGFGEFAVPFYSSTFCYSINPQNTIEISKSVTDFTHPDTQTLIIPGAQLTDLVVFRNAAPDFEMSYLSGPPILHEIALSE